MADLQKPYMLNYATIDAYIKTRSPYGASMPTRVKDVKDDREIRAGPCGQRAAERAQVLQLPTRARILPERAQQLGRQLLERRVAALDDPPQRACRLARQPLAAAERGVLDAQRREERLVALQRVIPILVRIRWRRQRGEVEIQVAVLGIEDFEIAADASPAPADERDAVSLDADTWSSQKADEEVRRRLERKVLFNECLDKALLDGNDPNRE